MVTPVMEKLEVNIFRGNLFKPIEKILGASDIKLTI